MRPLLTWLRQRDLCPDDPPPTSGPLYELMKRYRHWMRTDRQLAPLTMRSYELGARVFLGGRVLQSSGDDGIEGLREQDVASFLLAEASRGLSAKSMQGRVAQLRSLRRFL
jgi:site-specific recombinase XerC